MINTRKQAMNVARGQTRNVPGTCQANVRGWFNAPAAGDFDGDGDADAVDGWKSEPVWGRHVGDRNPPPGVPLSFFGGRSGFGHRALSMINGIQSTDMEGNRYKAGVTSLVVGSMPEAIAQIERSMGITYTGWTETIDGQLIPEEKKPPVKIPTVPVPKVVARVAKKAWRGFVHLKARNYMDYEAAIRKAGKRKTKKAVDIDTVLDKNKVKWALHWKTVGNNKLHDPQGKIKADAKIADLTTAEVSRLRGPKGQHPKRLMPMLRLAHSLGVRVEIELKVRWGRKAAAKFMRRKVVMAMNRQKDLQFKTLAQLPGSLNRLAPVHRVGGTTMLSFTGYTGKGLNKDRTDRVVDFIRGNPKWR